MNHQHRRGSLWSMLVRRERRRVPASSTPEHGDDHWCHASVVVRLGTGCVAVEGASFGPLYLAPLQVGRLRAALNAAAGHLAWQSRSSAVADPAARQS